MHSRTTDLLSEPGSKAMPRRSIALAWIWLLALFLYVVVVCVGALIWWSRL
jgi:hypothetical protein